MIGNYSKELRTAFAVGEKLVHPTFGKGEIVKIGLFPWGNILHVVFDGMKKEKTLDEKWTELNCELIRGD